MAAVFGLIDAAQDRRLYDLIAAEPNHACLFSGKLEPAVMRSSPYIVRLQAQSALARAWDHEGRGRNWGLKCISDADLSDLRRHFRNFLQAELPDRQTVLFRFWDPRVWRVYFPSCNAQELAMWFEDIKEYQCEQSNGFEIVSYKLQGGKLNVSLSPPRH